MECVWQQITAELSISWSKEMFPQQRLFLTRSLLKCLHLTLLCPCVCVAAVSSPFHTSERLYQSLKLFWWQTPLSPPGLLTRKCTLIQLLRSYLAHMRELPYDIWHHRNDFFSHLPISTSSMISNMVNINMCVNSLKWSVFGDLYKKYLAYLFE